ncbi:GPI inositol-deacylase [Mycena kentingensis (nom. inval.)]|nr:GPI inositol-deacylase [Mycena kentingensis (nom. inval.)]
MPLFCLFLNELEHVVKRDDDSILLLDRFLMRYVSLAGFLACFALFSTLIFHRATLDVVRDLSPQGCRMAYMYPSYLLQEGFDVAWTPLAKRYSLWLYREVDGWGRGWEPGHGVWRMQASRTALPVLFIPGNAGSSRQVRSIASSAARQYWEAPGNVAAEFRDGEERPLDFFAVEFNEDLSAFHGPTLEAQTAYTERAIAYILSHYLPQTNILLMGHSMGGVVATSLLTPRYNASDISAIITMSTPHTLPPARFDARIDAIYDATREVLRRDARTPIVSLCGGATDLMIPSESCVLPPAVDADAVRRTVFTSALEGAWTGVGHQEMVWCHQVRWRLARAALELGAVSTMSTRARGDALGRWLRDGHYLPPLPSNAMMPDLADAEILPPEIPLILHNPHGARTYLLPVPPKRPAKFVLLVSQGSVPPVGPQKRSSLTASVLGCSGATNSVTDRLRCSAEPPSVLKLVPNPIVGRPFPVPDGADEWEGVVLVEADVPADEFVGIRMENAVGEGWLVGGFVDREPVVSRVSTWQLLLGKASIAMPRQETFKTTFSFPNLLANALLVYRITPHQSVLHQSCDPLFAPLLAYTSQPAETHYFPLLVPPARKILLHTHSSAPHVHIDGVSPRGVDFSIYASGPSGCKSTLVGFDINIDWSSSFGRLASRYFAVIPVWATGIVAFILFQAWGHADVGAAVPTIEESISAFIGAPLRRSLFVSIVLSVVPLPETVYLGNRGELLLTGIAPLLLLISTGFVCASWYLLRLLLWPLSKLSRAGRRRREDITVHRSTVISMALVLLLIFLVVPWQVAFLGCWAIHLYNCAASQAHVAHLASIPEVVAIPLLRREDEPRATPTSAGEAARRPPAPPPPYIAANHNHGMHILLLMTWLLPLAAPVLVVWARTLAGTGLTTPFDGDHFVLSAAPFLVLVDFASWIGGPVFEMQRFERRLSTRWSFAAVAAVSFLLGARKAYLVFDVAKVAIGLVVVIRVGPRYWGRSSCAPA